MDQLVIKKQILNWITEFIEQPNSKFGNWAPCPYARTARINNQLHIVFSSADQLHNTVEANLCNLSQYEVIIIAFDHRDISGPECLQLIKDINEKLVPQNCVVFEDHPDIPEIVAGIQMNFGGCGLIVMQQLDSLNRAADKLKKAGYYDHWDQASLDKIVNWRYPS